jgi:hypothetical protein
MQSKEIMIIEDIIAKMLHPLKIKLKKCFGQNHE